MLVTPAPQRPVEAALVTVTPDRAQSASQVNVSNVPLVQLAVAALAVKPVSQATVQDAASAMLVTPAPQTPVEAAFVTVGKAQPGVHVMDSRIPSAQAAVAVFGK
jgi:hypothetical protein